VDAQGSAGNVGDSGDLYPHHVDVLGLLLSAD